MPEAVVLIAAESRILARVKPSPEDILEKVSQLEGVQKAAVITGPYDIAAWVEADSMDKITQTLIEKIRSIEGVKKTVTHMVIRSK
ncbi:hypothetical protein AKJ40_01020 [candidate division MSBL1 archaeon SCGC-AAA259M10]|uniref:Transcription regulator AsnC/Lrp ligand binding domain-containing protein n=2 Tax=candidate division MSBL1 TaxID=215777 RepID=A0A133V2I4_9EURY|nr:hypothetical protein AKJ36_00670 [candidate division MSBL1 archaeon SCGC-AAA259I07]KXB00657.1 hypothetical protein AKJ40_01020 [candidate division MSBL1 archaeon SCGC-AAA259M10]